METLLINNRVKSYICEMSHIKVNEVQIKSTAIRHSGMVV